MEVRQSTNANNEYYLTLLHPSLADSNITTTSLSGLNWLGVYTPDASSGEVVIYSKSTNFANNDIIDYTISINSEAKHYIADLSPLQKYSITATNNGTNVHLIITKDAQGQYTSSNQGLLGFRSYYDGGNNIQLEEISLGNNNSPNNYRADVNNSGTIDSTDAMLTLRSSLGLNMSNTNWQASASTGDVNCDDVTNFTDANLILKYSLGLDVSGDGWCVN